MKVLRDCLLASIILLPMQAGAQTLKDVEQREAELVAAWEKSPLLIRNATFVTEKAPLYGSYSPKPDHVFKPGEPILTYMEPVGYSWKPKAPGVIEFGITLDVVLKDKDGKILGGQEKLMNYSQTSRHRVRELMLNVTLNLTNIPAGEYIVEFVAHDIGGKRSATSLPFVMGQ